MEKNKIIISFILILIGVTLRLLPHPWNFAPISAIALFSGVYLGKRYVLFVPVLAMFLGDIFLGFYQWKLMLAVYGSFVLVGFIGLVIKKHKSFKTILSGGLGASILFYLITNWAVWQFTVWYPKTLSGLIQSYILALPFLRYTLFGDLFYVAIFFGTYELILLLTRRMVLFEKKKLVIA